MKDKIFASELSKSNSVDGKSKSVVPGLMAFLWKTDALDSTQTKFGAAHSFPGPKKPKSSHAFSSKLIDFFFRNDPNNIQSGV